MSSPSPAEKIVDAAAALLDEDAPVSRPQMRDMIASEISQVRAMITSEIAQLRATIATEVSRMFSLHVPDIVRATLSTHDQLARSHVEETFHEEYPEAAPVGNTFPNMGNSFPVAYPQQQFSNSIPVYPMQLPVHPMPVHPVQVPTHPVPVHPMTVPSQQQMQQMPAPAQQMPSSSGNNKRARSTLFCFFCTTANVHGPADCNSVTSRTVRCGTLATLQRCQRCTRLLKTHDNRFCANLRCTKCGASDHSAHLCPRHTTA